jgi:hypothetical protein
MSTGVVPIPTEVIPIIGEPDSCTRIFRKEGSQEECGAWFDALMQIFGPCVSPGGISMYCPVSRAAVHKRIKEGKMTLFLFHVRSNRTGLFGQRKVVRESPYGYIPASEARAWRAEIEQRMLENGSITIEELEGAKPDWQGSFLEWNAKRRKKVKEA